ncbi:DUF4124 domain-containing protein [Hydrogenophaga sp. 5NK40-0174]|uniref:DUF4124 domain-containing protein n=1 Tax=Hydrogenophaga sp. 5NK40-0174 TaxID=3127649 RepID=UPI00333F97D0
MNTLPLKKRLPWRQFVLALGCATFLAGNAWGQWGWTNSAGKKEFSDRPPPQSVPEDKIFMRPSGGAAVRVDGEPATAAAKAQPGDPAKSFLDEKVASQEDEAKEKAEDERKALLAKRKVERAENCSRAKEAKATLGSGLRISKTNAQGERVYLDEQELAAEKKRADQIIKSECGPDPMAKQP